MQKSVSFQYTGKEQLDFDIFLKNTVYNSTKNNEVLKYKSNKLCQDLYVKNYKSDERKQRRCK